MATSEELRGGYLVLISYSLFLLQRFQFCKTIKKPFKSEVIRYRMNGFLLKLMGKMTDHFLLNVYRSFTHIFS